ncbi:MAG: indole-3-glycerol-phosphate synthase TrpC, partial [Thermoplasmatota archaeon]
MSLQRFLDDARNRIAGGGYQTPHRLQSNGSLAAALQRPDAIIAELKPRSPSEGRILNTQADKVLDDYVRGGAAALSILTDVDHFDGSLDLLAQANATGLPTMMKDFILDERQ